MALIDGSFDYVAAAMKPDAKLMIARLTVLDIGTTNVLVRSTEHLPVGTVLNSSREYDVPLDAVMHLWDSSYSRLVTRMKARINNAARELVRQTWLLKGILWTLERARRRDLDQLRLVGNLEDEKAHYQASGYAKDIAEADLDADEPDAGSPG